MTCKSCDSDHKRFIIPQEKKLVGRLSIFIIPVLLFLRLLCLSDDSGDDENYNNNNF